MQSAITVIMHDVHGALYCPAVHVLAVGINADRQKRATSEDVALIGLLLPLG